MKMTPFAFAPPYNVVVSLIFTSYFRCKNKNVPTCTQIYCTVYIFHNKLKHKCQLVYTLSVLCFPDGPGQEEGVCHQKYNGIRSGASGLPLIQHRMRNRSIRLAADR